MKILIPLAGMGWRFANAGYKEAKPLINIDGRPVIEYVVELFPGEAGKDFIFVCNKEHLAKTDIKKVLLTLKPNANVLEVDYEKKGPVYGGVLLVADKIPDNEPIILSYCDYFMHWNYNEFKNTVTALGVDSASVCYNGFHPHLIGPNLYAGVRTDKNNLALEVREKFSFTQNKMDTWQQTGTFYFKTGALLKKYAREVFEKDVPINGEHYISQLFNPMIRDGYTSLVYPTDFFMQWGTPEDLEEYEAWSQFFANKAGVQKGETSKPDGRPQNKKLSLTPDEFEKSYEYWKLCFSLLKHHPYHGVVWKK